MSRKSKVVFEKVIEANIQSDSACDFDHASIKLTRTFAKHILHLANVVRKEQVATIHLWDYTPDFLCTDYDTDKLVEAETRTDCEQLVVSDKSFWWEGCLKDSDIHWSTDNISIKELQVLFAPIGKLPPMLGDCEASVEQVILNRLAAGS